MDARATGSHVLDGPQTACRFPSWPRGPGTGLSRCPGAGLSHEPARDESEGASGWRRGASCSLAKVPPPVWSLRWLAVDGSSTSDSLRLALSPKGRRADQFRCIAALARQDRESASQSDRLARRRPPVAFPRLLRHLYSVIRLIPNAVETARSDECFRSAPLNSHRRSCLACCL